MGTSVAACAPVQVKNCDVRKYNDRGVTFEADVYNRSNKMIEKVNIQVWTASSEGGSGSDNYTVGPIAPGLTTHLITIAQPNGLLLFSRDFRLYPIQKCFLQSIQYQDGTFQTFYMPI